MLKTIIIDDERDAVEAVESVVNEFCPQLEIIGKFQSPIDAIPFIIKHIPELLLLDIEMPHMNGFELLDQIPNRQFEVIFITAYDEYAVRAFKASAIDYILKPITITDIVQATNKVIEKLEKEKDFEKRYTQLLDHLKNIQPNRIQIPTSNGTIYINAKEIIYIEADGSYSKIYMQDNTINHVSKNLKELSEILTESCFFRAHKSYLINIEKIKKYTINIGGEIVMSDGSKISLARRKKEDFLKLISQ